MNNTQLRLHSLAEFIKTNGPDRIVINSSGEATTPKRAEEYGIKPTVIFIRTDNWSLGAPKQFAEVACELWRDAWIARMELIDGEWHLFDADGKEVLLS